MKRVLAALVLTLALAGLGAQAQADPNEYGIKAASASTSTDRGGAHPDFDISFELKTEKEEGKRLPSTSAEIGFELPPGLLANLKAVPKCTTAQLVETDTNDPTNATGCPQDSQAGITLVRLFNEGGLNGFTEPVFNMEPGYGEPARFGFIADRLPVIIDTELQPGREYGVRASVRGAASLIPLLSADTTLWGVPADESHDGQRITAYEGIRGGVPLTPSGKRSSSLSPVPFMVNPTRCGVSRDIAIAAIPYALPNLRAEAIAPLGPGFECGPLDFRPDISILPTTTNADSGSGLNAELTFPQDGLEHPNLFAEAHMQRAEVTLPEGMTVNPSQAAGLGACSEADFARESAASLPGQGCPESSKIGTVVATSPVLSESAEGSIYVASPRRNPFGSLIAVYMVLKIPDRGVIVKLPGKVLLDSITGQLTTTFEDLPQLPVSSFKLHFREGPRSPLVTPARCGTYRAVSKFTPWSDPAKVVTKTSTFEVTHGLGAGACPQGALPFSPELVVRPLKLNAGAFSSFFARLIAHDGEQDLTRVSATLPKGLVAKLAGVTRCADGLIEQARSRGGAEELAAPSCPASSRVGSVLAGAGVGSSLTYASGGIYLAGPYHGAPLSVAAIVPAVAGPFDLGTVVTRGAVDLDPKTGQVQLDGGRSDPVPRILEGIPLRLKDVRVNVDRPEFGLNPTSCDPLSIRAQLWGAGIDPLSAADDASVSLSVPFQVGNCARLGFAPKLSLKLNGGTKRGRHPALRAVLRPRPGDANFSAASVTLPHSAFLDQAHIRTVCTRVQFGAHSCPPGSVYGHARGVSPLLDEPVEGPVYLRSSSHKLPDLVAALKGPPSLPIEFNLDGRIDSVDGGIRSRFQSIPDVPVSKFVLSMRGGKKGLIINSRDLCGGTQRANARLVAQNGKSYDFNPVLKNDCVKAPRKKNEQKRGRK
jgi:hypothetical protein